MSAMNFLQGAIRSGLLGIALSASPVSECHAGQDPERPDTGSVHQSADLRSGLLEKVVSLYPDLGFQRDGAEAFISSVREVARISLDNGEERLAIGLFIIVPAARVDHGRSEFFVFKDATDVHPIVRLQGHTLPMKSFSDVRVVRDRWLQFGDGPLISLVEPESMDHLRQRGYGCSGCGLARVAARGALTMYLNEGREAFLRLAPIREHRESHVEFLPERIRQFEFYPSIVQDGRRSGYKYYDSWEATVLVRLIPVRGSDEPVVLEMGARGSSAGIEAHEVELFLWETRTTEPTDRPGPGELSRSSPEP